MKPHVLIFGTTVALFATVIAPSRTLPQNPNVPAACSFDTAAHTDQLTLELSVRVFRGNDSLADPLLTRGMGDLLRGHFIPPATFGGLLYPNTYFANTRPNFTSSFGSIQFEMSPQGSASQVKWYAVSLDQATDDALESAVREAFKSEDFKLLAGSTGWTTTETVRVQLLVTQDTILHSPLARMKVPMVRVDSRPIPGSVAIPADELRALANAPPVEFEFTVDQSGKPVRSSVQIVQAPSPSATSTALLMMLSREYKPAQVGGCPVAMRFRVTTH